MSDKRQTELYGCKKENEYKDASICALEMKEKFKDDLSCIENLSVQTHLYVGTYKNKQVYFVKKDVQLVSL